MDRLRLSPLEDDTEVGRSECTAAAALAVFLPEVAVQEQPPGGQISFRGCLRRTGGRSEQGLAAHDEVATGRHQPSPSRPVLRDSQAATYVHPPHLETGPRVHDHVPVDLGLVDALASPHEACDRKPTQRARAGNRGVLARHDDFTRADNAAIGRQVAGHSQTEVVGVHRGAGLDLEVVGHGGGTEHRPSLSRDRDQDTDDVGGQAWWRPIAGQRPVIRSCHVSSYPHLHPGLRALRGQAQHESLRPLPGKSGLSRIDLVEPRVVEYVVGGDVDVADDVHIPRSVHRNTARYITPGGAEVGRETQGSAITGNRGDERITPADRMWLDLADQREVLRGSAPDHMRDPARVDRYVVGRVRARAAQVGGVDETGARRVQLCHERVLAILRHVEGPGRHRIVRRIRVSHHNRASGGVHVDTQGLVAPRAAEIGRVEHRSSLGVELGHKGIAVHVAVRQLKRTRRHGERLRFGMARHVCTAAGVDGNGAHLVPARPPEECRVIQRAVGHQLHHKRVSTRDGGVDVPIPVTHLRPLQGDEVHGPRVPRDVDVVLRVHSHRVGHVVVGSAQVRGELERGTVRAQLGHEAVVAGKEAPLVRVLGTEGTVRGEVTGVRGADDIGAAG